MAEATLTAEELDLLLEEEDLLHLDRGALVDWMDLAYDLYHDPEHGDDARRIGAAGPADALIEAMLEAANEETERPIIAKNAGLVKSSSRLLGHLRMMLARTPDAGSPPGVHPPDHYSDEKIEFGMPRWLQRWVDANADAVGLPSENFLDAVFSAYLRLGAERIAGKVEEDELTAARAHLARSERLMQQGVRRGRLSDLDRAGKELANATVKLAESQFDQERLRAVVSTLNRSPRNVLIVDQVFNLISTAWLEELERQEGRSPG